ncbi:hypothetical protein Tco_0104561 [Tanacetum coccineum]
MIEGTGPKWLFDIDSLTQSMNYVPVTAGTVSNDSVGKSEENSQDSIVMPIWKDTSYFDSPTKDVDNGEPKTADDAQKQVEDGLNNENAEQERFTDDSSTKDVNAVEQLVISTVSPNEETNTEEEPEVDLGNITNSYIVPTTPNTRIHKDHPIDNVIGEVQSTVQTRRMSKPTSEQGFLSDKQCRRPSAIFKLQQFWILVISLMGKKAIGTKYRSSKTRKMKVELRLGTKQGPSSTPVDFEKPLVNDGDADMLIFQVTPKTSHLLAVKRIFRYFKGKPTLVLWYSRDSPFELVAYTDSDYAGSTQDRKSTTGGCEDSDHLTDSTPIHIIDQPSSSSQPKKKQPSKKAQRQEAEVPQDEVEHEESVPTPSNDPQPSAKEIAALKKRIQRLERRKMSRPTGLKRLRKVGMSRRVVLRKTESLDKMMINVLTLECLEDEEMHVKLKVDGKDEHSTKTDIRLKQLSLKLLLLLLQQQQQLQDPRIKGWLYRSQVTWKAKEKKEEGREETTKGSRKKMLGRKRAGKEQQKESSKKQKVEEEKESEEVDEVDEAELKKLLVIKKDEDIAIDAIPLATKLLVIIDYKLHKEGMLVHYQLIRADGSSKRYSSMIRMLQGIDREDLEALWRIVKAKYGDTRPDNEFERVLWGDLKVMFEPDKRSDVWRILQGYRVTIWKLIDSSGVHFVRFDNLYIFMLVEKRYPLTPITITNMLNKKLQTDHQNEMCYQLLKLMVKQQKVKGEEDCQYKLLLLVYISKQTNVTTAYVFLVTAGGKIKYITDVIVDHLHQPWRTFASIINKCLYGKDLAYQIDNKDTKKQDKMFYPRFMKIIIHHFLEKDKSISMRNRTFMHTARDDSLLGTMRLASRYEDTQVYGAILPKAMTNQAMLDSVAYKTYYAIASGAEPPKLKKPKTKSNSAISSEETPSEKKPTKAKKDVPSKKKPASKSKPTKKAPVKADRGKSDGTNFESGVPDEQQRKLFGTDERIGVKPGVPDVPKYDSESNKESCGDSVEEDDDDEDDTEDDEGNDDGDDSDGNDDDDDNDGDDDDDNDGSFTLKDYDEEEHDEEYESDDDKENVYKEEDGDLYKDSYEQVVEDAHVTLTSSQKTESSKQSSSVSSNFASKFLILDNVPPVVDEVAFMMNVKILDDLLSRRIGYASRTALQSYTKEFEKKPQEERKLYIDVVEKSSTINESLENVIVAKSSSRPKSTYEAAVSLTEFELKKVLLDKIEKSKSYQAAPEHRELYDGLVKSYNLDKDLFLLYGNVYSLKRDREDEDKDEDPPVGSNQCSSKGSKSKSKSSGKSAQAEEPVFETVDTKMTQDQGDDMGNTEDQPNIKEASKHDWFKKPEKPPTPDRTCKSRVELEFHFEECYKAVTDKLDWHNREGHEYPFDLSKPLPLIKDQARQVVPANYFFNNDLEYLKGGSSRGRYTTSTTKTKATKIIAVTHVKVMKKYDYGYLDKIIVRREDHKLYKFKEGDFPRLNLRDIEDMLLLLVQKKLPSFKKDNLFDLNVALRMFARRVVILKQVEDLQLGFESYQKKLNITKPKTFRLMRLDKLYKFCDGTLSSVRRVLHDIASSLEMDYLPKRIWSKLDRKSSCIMIKANDQRLFERRLMRNLEKFIGGREYGNDFRLLERTI